MAPARATFEVFTAPLDVVLADDTVMEPDIVVGRERTSRPANCRLRRWLAVEVLSPSTRRFDLTLKKSRFEAAGMQCHWVVDPLEPSLLAWDLRHDSYVEVARVEGGSEWTAELPYPITIDPAKLASDY
ncbi:MAG: Uma2 family endonuclease [Jatrophihabitans sp.]